MAKIVPHGVSHVVACHIMWLFVLRGLLLVWKVVMELFWALPCAHGWYRTSVEFIFVLIVAHLAHLEICSNYVEDATSF